jgi:ABC-type protease/lipase transport system fused ATPase/permease subunit
MDDAELKKRLDTIDAALTKIHQWQAERPSGEDLAQRLDEILETYGLTAQLLEVWLKQRPEIQSIHRDVGRLTEAIAELKRLLREAHKAVGGEERG